MPEFVLRIGPTTRFATYGRFFKKSKMSENRQKTSKTEGFLRFFNVRSNPLRESGCRVSKTEGFLRFWCARICPHDLFCYIRALQTLSRGVSRWFQRGLKLTFFFKKRLRNGSMIRFESYGGSKLDEIGPDELFCYIRPLQGHPEASSDGFRGVSEGSETIPFFKKKSKMAL